MPSLEEIDQRLQTLEQEFSMPIYKRIKRMWGMIDELEQRLSRLEKLPDYYPKLCTIERLQETTSRMQHTLNSMFNQALKELEKKQREYDLNTEHRPAAEADR